MTNAENAVVIYFGGLMHNLYTIFYGIFYIDVNKAVSARLRDLYTYKYGLLSVWNLFLQLFYYIITLVDEYADLPLNWKQKLHNFRGHIYHALIFPIGIGNYVFFWGCYVINKAYIYPLEYEKFIPDMFNHCMNSFGLILPFSELVFRNLPQPRYARCFATITAYYWACVLVNHWIYLVSDHYIYPIIDNKTEDERVKLSYVGYGVACLLLLSGKFLFWFKNERKRQAQRYIEENRRRTMSEIQQQLEAEKEERRIDHQRQQDLKDKQRQQQARRQSRTKNKNKKTKKH